MRVPAGLPPRAALGSLFGALAAVLEYAGVTGPTAPDIRAAAHACDAVAGDRGGGVASELGEAVATSTTWVYGHGPLSAVARRFKCQLNENAKSAAVLRRAPRSRPQRDRRLGRHAPHRGPPRGHPPGRPGRPAHDPRQHRHIPPPDRRRRNPPPRPHRPGPDPHRTSLLAARPPRPRLGLHGTRSRRRSIRDRPHRRAQTGTRRSRVGRLFAERGVGGVGQVTRAASVTWPLAASRAARSWPRKRFLGVGDVSAVGQVAHAASVIWHAQPTTGSRLDCVGFDETRGRSE